MLINVFIPTTVLVEVEVEVQQQLHHVSIRLHPPVKIGYTQRVQRVLPRLHILHQFLEEEEEEEEEETDHVRIVRFNNTVQFI